MSVWKAFGRGFNSRRLHHFFCILLLGGSLPLMAEENRLLVFEGAHKSEIDLRNIEGGDYVRVADLQTIFD